MYLSTYLSIDLSIYLSRYLSIHRAVSLSIYLSIDLAPRASSFFSMQKNDGCRSAHGIIFLRRQTVVRWVRKKHNDARDNFGTCCRVRSAARKNTRFIQSGAAKPAPVLCALEKNCDAESGRRTDGPEETPSTVAPWVRKKKHHSRDNFGSNTGTCCRVRSAARRNTRFIQSGAAKPAPRLCAWRNTATQKADAAPMGQKKHHPCGVRTRSPATTRSPAKRSNCRYSHATTYDCFETITCNELPLLLRPRACNELQLLLRHRAVRKNTHAGEVICFEAITCNELPLHAMNYSCCCAIVRSEETDTLATTYPATNYIDLRIT